MSVRRWSLVALGVSLLASPALGQAAGAAGATARPAPANRMQLERNLRRAMWRATKVQVGLTDPQMNRLDSLTRRLEPQRAALLRREREARRALRSELQAPQPDHARVSRQLDEIRAVQRARVDLLDEEQRRLGEFLSPVQRARYFALQEQFRRRIEQLRRPGARPLPGDPGVPSARRPRL